jgi:hypothetical protein
MFNPRANSRLFRQDISPVPNRQENQADAATDPNGTSGEPNNPEVTN